jgi:voltage-gated potassium channel
MTADPAASPLDPAPGAAVQAPSASGDRPSLRKRIFQLIETGSGENRWSEVFNGAIVALIILNVLGIILETVPGIRAGYHRWLNGLEVFTIAVFTIEYVLRLWTAVEMPYLKRMTPLKARLYHAKSPALIIDLLAIAPFYLQHLLPLELGILRMLRLLRLLKLSRYSPAMHTLIRVLQNERKALIGACLLLMLAILFTATLMYHLESAAQPDTFGSIPQSMWWAITTLTTVGYGDAVPVTPFGRLLGGLTMVLGLCILALPVAIISTGFAQEVHRRDFVVNWSLMSRVPMLAELDAKEAAEIMPLLHAHHLPPNVEIVRKGAPGDAIYFIASGRMDQHCETQRKSYHTGDVIGAHAMLNNLAHEGHVITTSKVRLLKLHKEDFERIEARSPHVAAHIRSVARAHLEAHIASHHDAT